MQDFNETFDFVIVGSGGGSMCAALVMRERGKSAIVLEKTDMVGGTTALSGGVMWIPNNRFLKRDRVEDSFEKASLYLDILVGDNDDTPGASRERRSTYLAHAPEMIEFLIGQGIKFDRVRHWPDYNDELPGGLEEGRTVTAQLFDINRLGPWRDKLRRGFLPLPATNEEAFELPYYKQSWRSKMIVLKVGIRSVLARLTGRQLAARGTALQGRMLEAALAAGVDIRTDHPVSELIVENGKVAGILTTRDGKEWRIGARLGVLVNAGGFACNQEMRDRYQPGTSKNWTMAAEGDTGEMIQEMMRHGGAIAQMEEMIGHQLTIPPGAEQAQFKPSAQALTGSPHCILIDRAGVRYMNEAGSYMAYCQGILARDRQVPANPSWAVFDALCMRRYMVAGTMPGSKKPQSWYDSGFLRTGETVEDLARSIECDPAQLSATIDRFNRFVRNGRDEDFQRGDRAYDRWLGDPFHKPSPSLGTIEEGPFYAIPVVPGDVGTYGGVVTDVHARVLREDGSLIEGLYATGVSTASVMGRSYPGGGASVGPSFVWGYVAARHAAETAQ
ncbi:MAG: FAD-dependent oxidoreductase [Novosphingobium sp.]|nr:FAD-dependent oxidoreductase [Novosphingobium sp.]